MGGSRVSKAKRGKHRWIGLSIPDELSNRSQLEEFLKTRLNLQFHWRLFDLVSLDDGTKAILRVRLEDYQTTLDELNNDSTSSLTSSGKIRLVRERLGIMRPPKKKKR